MSNQTRKWIRGGLETIIHGATAALSSTIAAATVDGHDWGLGTNNFWRLAAVTFAANGGIRFLQWWSQNPLPPSDETEINLNPLKPTTENQIPKGTQ